MLRFFPLFLLLLFSCTSTLPSPPSLPATSTRQFITRRGRCLFHRSQPFRALGSNAFYLQEDASRELRGVETSRGRVDRTLDLAHSLGLRVLRIAAFHEGSSPDALQSALGVWNEAGLRGLDFVLARAAERDLRIILVLGNYWEDYGGLPQYLRWHQLPTTRSSRAIRDDRIANAIARYATMLTQRVNHLTNMRYADDPTILGWEPLNEPRAEGFDDQGETLTRWVHSIACSIKENAPRQLVFAGDEGYDALVAGYDFRYWQTASATPLIGAARHESFTRSVEDPCIDAGSVHWYPRAWGVHARQEVAAGERWIAEHARIAARARKPLLVTEFALPGGNAEAEELRAVAYARWIDVAAEETNIAVALPWGLAPAPEGFVRDGFAWGWDFPPAGVVRSVVRERANQWLTSDCVP